MARVAVTKGRFSISTMIDIDNPENPKTNNDYPSAFRPINPPSLNRGYSEDSILTFNSSPSTSPLQDRIKKYYERKSNNKTSVTFEKPKSHQQEYTTFDLAHCADQLNNNV